MSRESVIWSEHTRHYLQNIIDNAIKEANSIVSNQLDEPDFVQWLKKAVGIKTGNTNDWTLSNIAKITDLTAITPVYKLNDSIKLEAASKFFTGFNARYISIRSKYIKNKGYLTFVDRIPVNSWEGFNNLKGIYYYENDIMNGKKDHYILNGRTDQKFLVLTPSTVDLETDPEVLVKRDAIFDYIKASGYALNYSSVDVPESYSYKAEEEEPMEEVESTVANPYAGMSDAERRKLTEKIVVHYPQLKNYGYWSSSIQSDEKGIFHKYVSTEIKGQDFIEDKASVYYINDSTDKELGVIAGLIESGTRGFKNGLADKVYNNNIKIVRVSSSMPKKYLVNHKPIYSYFGYKPLFTNKDTCVMLSPNLVKWNTIRLIKSEIDSCKFLENYSFINSSLSDIYNELKRLVDNHVDMSTWSTDWRISKNTQLIDVLNDTTKFLDKLNEFTLFAEVNKNDPEALKAKSLEIFGVESINHVNSIDFDLYNKYRAIKEYSSEIKDLFNLIDFSLVKDDEVDTFKVEQSINKLLALYGLDKFDLSDFDVELKVEESEVVNVVENPELVDSE